MFSIPIFENVKSTTYKTNQHEKNNFTFTIYFSDRF